MKIRLYTAFLALPLAFVGCKKAEDASKVNSADSVAVQVVTASVKVGPYKEWIRQSAELRGLEDAILVTSAMGRVNSIAAVGKAVKAGEGLCDIETERYKAQLDAAVAAAEAAKGEMERAKANVEAGSLGKSAQEGATAGYLGARVNMLNARKQWEDSRCQAPFSGRLASRMVERWTTVGPGTPMVRLLRTDKLEAMVAIPEADAHLLRTGNEATFSLLDHKRVWTGKITALDLAVEPRHRTVMARIEIANTDGYLSPGMMGRAKLLVKDWKEVVRVPSSALLRKETGVSAMVDRGGVAREVQVELGSADGDSVLVRSGLADADKLIVQGAFRVSDGNKIKN